MHDGFIASRPCRVLFAGWETTTTRLQASGWELAAHQDPHCMRIGLVMRYAPARLHMLCESQGFDFFRFADPRSDHIDPPTFVVKQAFSEGTFNFNDDLRQYRQIDAATQYCNRVRKSIEDFNLFSTPLTRTEEIIVKPEDVADLLERIKKLQEPELNALRARNRLRDLRGSTEAIPAQNFHAQIISLAA